MDFEERNLFTIGYAGSPSAKPSSGADEEEEEDIPISDGSLSGDLEGAS